MFEPFVRGETSREGGSGLGLAIARGFVEAHGGSIWIEHAPPAARHSPSGFREERERVGPSARGR